MSNDLLIGNGNGPVDHFYKLKIKCHKKYCSFQNQVSKITNMQTAIDCMEDAFCAFKNF